MSDEVVWMTVRVVEAYVRGASYRIEEPRGCNGEVNVYRNGEFIGPSRSMASAKDAIERGLT